MRMDPPEDYYGPTGYDDCADCGSSKVMAVVDGHWYCEDCIERAIDEERGISREGQ